MGSLHMSWASLKAGLGASRMPLTFQNLYGTPKTHFRVNTLNGLHAEITSDFFAVQSSLRAKRIGANRSVIAPLV